MSNFSRATSHGNKISQKQKKLMALAAKDNNPEIVPDAVVLSTAPKTTKPATVWYEPSYFFRLLLIGVISGFFQAHLWEGQY